MRRRYSPEYGSPEQARLMAMRRKLNEHRGMTSFQRVFWAILLAVVVFGTIWGVGKVAYRIFHHVPIVGTVYNKQDNPPYTWLYEQPVYTNLCSGNPMVCTQVFSYFIPITEYEPEQFELIVLTDTGKYRTAHVSRDQYAATYIGDHFAEAGAK
jgi:hypothetical protein